MNERVKSVAVAVLALRLVTCGRGSSHVDVIVKNSTHSPIHAATVSFGQFQSVAWDLAAEHAINEKQVPSGVPKIAKVTWKSADGGLHQVDVRVKQFTPSDFKEGDGIIFSLQSDGSVVLKFQIWKGMRAFEVPSTAR